MRIKKLLITIIQRYEKPASSAPAAQLLTITDELQSGQNPSQGVARLPVYRHTANKPSPLYKKFTNKMEVIRFIAIASIVWGHTLFGWQNQTFTTTAGNLVQLVFMQLGRVGTINFFSISGFSLSAKVNEMSVAGYIKYRWRSIILPWFIFIVLFIVIQLCQMYTLSQLQHTGVKQVAQLAGNLFSAAIFHSAFWFIPLSLLSAILLIVFRTFIYKKWFACLLLCISLFYSINLYLGWLPVNHAKSYAGYVFFVWLGIQVKNNKPLVKRLVDAARWPYLLAAILIAFVLSCNEGRMLQARGCTDPFASIRLSNEVLSILLFAALLKWRTVYRIKKLEPKKYVYGVYLVHTIVVLQLLPWAAPYIVHYNLFNNLPLIMLVQFAAFVFVLTASYLLSVVIKNSKLHFITGR